MIRKNARRNIGLIFLAVGLLMSWSAWSHARTSLGNSRWPSVVGRIDESTVVQETITIRKTGKELVAYDPVVKYSYTVNGTALKGSRISFANLVKTRENPIEALAVSSQFTAGSTRPVFYNPDMPEVSVLLPKELRHPYDDVFVGLVIAGFGVFLLALPLLVRLAFSRNSPNDSPAPPHSGT